MLCIATFTLFSLHLNQSADIEMHPGIDFYFPGHSTSKSSQPTHTKAQHCSQSITTQPHSGQSKVFSAGTCCRFGRECFSKHLTGLGIVTVGGPVTVYPLRPGILQLKVRLSAPKPKRPPQSSVRILDADELVGTINAQIDAAPLAL